MTGIMIPAGLIVIGPKGQRFVCQGHDDYQKEDGSKVLLTLWASTCRTRGVPIEDRSQHGVIDVPRLRKNCAKHKHNLKGARKK